jgi:heterodisulfide reductase subunit A
MITEDPITHNLFVHSEDVTLGRVTELEYDMIMLQSGCHSTARCQCNEFAAQRLAKPRRLVHGISSKLRPMDSPTDGVFLCGACQGVKTSRLAWRKAQPQPHVQAHLAFGRVGN